MRRWAGILLLCLASIYLGATSLDQCDEGVNDDCAPICHILCADGCATVPVPETPVPPAPDPLPRLLYKVERTEQLVSLVMEPEKDPPRA
ncbi:MAG TPA: hypothetical protein VJ623_00965 [Holophagaceae bacterium]|nr:hypothetical protein [Holophagaceae bacterium]